MPSRKKARIGPGVDLSEICRDDARRFVGKNMDFKPADGTLRLFGEPYLLLRPEVLVNIQKQLEQTVGASSKGFLYLAGEKSARDGLHLVKELQGEMGLDSSPVDSLRRMMDVLALLGWGRFHVARVDAGEPRYTFLLENSPIATFYGPSRKPVCHLFAGWLAGIAREVLGQSLLCEETGCKAQGRPRCEFDLRSAPFS